MAIDTVLLAVGPMDTVRAPELAETVLEIADPLGATVVIGHAFTKDEYEDVHDDLDLEARVDDIDPDEVAARRAPVPELAERFEGRPASTTKSKVHSARSVPRSSIWRSTSMQIEWSSAVGDVHPPKRPFSVPSPRRSSCRPPARSPTSAIST